MRFRILALLLAFAAASFTDRAAARADVNTTLPSQCAADDHPRGCWGDVRRQDLFAGVRGGLGYEQCPNYPAMRALDEASLAQRRTIAAKKYAHAFMIPQAQAVFVSLAYGRVADETERCASTADQPRRARLQALAVFDRYYAADWARTAGSATYFQQYSTRFFHDVDALTAPGVDQWAREYAFWAKHAYCVEENPDIGPQNPDYGRLFTWDDYHRVGCDNFRYD